NYREIVLQALRDVSDVLRAIEHDAQALSAHAAADASAQASLRSMQQRHALGAASFLELLIVQQQAQQTKIELIAMQAQRLADSVALYQAIGGGWKEPATHFRSPGVV
ncbi:MAG TPA: TolC family protein, partial [Luteimonas sp.]|nr:TolC family protein [Luteimonas sp.]